MPIFYMRNDDINILDDELVAVSRRCTDLGVPITHAVEPANLTDEATEWLLREKSKAPRLIEIMQHGFDHQKRDRGEFGGNRPFESQYQDLAKGKQIMLEKFGEDFLPCLNYPFGPYNRHSMRAADQLGFRIISSHYNCRLSRRVMYGVGHLLRLGQIRGRHVSYHLDFYPRTGMFSVDMAVSFIKSYQGEYGARTCTFHPAEWVVARAKEFLPFTPVIGILLHHRYHTTDETLDLITRVVTELKAIPGAEFLNMGEIYQKFCPAPGTGFRNG